MQQKHSMTKPLLILTAALLAGCTATAVSQVEAVHEGMEYDQPSSVRGHHFTRDFSGAKIYGKGPYRYRLVLQAPIIDGQPEANQPYALSHDEADFFFVNNEKKVFQDTTDHLGRTAVFAFEEPVNPDKWLLRLRTGSGSYGEQFRLIDSDDQPLKGFDYAILVCNPKPYLYRGKTDNRGYTAYAATAAEGIDLMLYDGVEDEADPLPESRADMLQACADTYAERKKNKR